MFILLIDDKQICESFILFIQAMDLIYYVAALGGKSFQDKDNKYMLKSLTGSDYSSSCLDLTRLSY